MASKLVSQDTVRAADTFVVRARIVVPGLVLLAITGTGNADVTYTYDEHGRLATESFTSTTGDAVTIEYVYDNAGNRLHVITTSNDLSPPSPPTGLSATVISANQINLTWSASTDTGSSGVAGYKIWRNNAVIHTTTATSHADTTVTGSTTYQYAVSSYDGAGNNSAKSPTVSVTTPDTTPPSTPSGLTGYAVDPYWVNLSWTASTDTGGSGLAGYEVYRDSTLLGTTIVNSYSDKTVLPSTSYTYTVRAYDGANNKSGMSAAFNITTPVAPDTTPPTVPSNLSASAVTSNRVNLSWSASTDPGPGASGVGGYVIYRGGVQIGTSSTNSYSDTTTTCNTSYSYRVAAFDNVNNTSAQSTAVSVTTPDTIAPTTPTNVTANAVTSDRVNLSWSAATDPCGVGVAGYRIYRDGVQIGTSSTTSYSDTTTAGSTSYSYSVLAYDSANNSSAMSGSVSVITPDTIKPSTPTGFTASAPLSTQVNLSWNASIDTGGSGLQGYRLYRNGSLIASPTGTSYTDNTVSANTNYTYQVTARDNAGNESNAASVNITTPPNWIQITDTVGNVLVSASSLYAVVRTCVNETSLPICTQRIDKKYGDRATVYYWGEWFPPTTCATVINQGPTQPGYRLKTPGTCAVEADPAVYGH